MTATWRRQARRKAGVGALAVLLVAALWQVVPVPPSSARSIRTTQRGLDACNAPSVSQMRAFWTRTPYGWFNMYVGGSMRACANTNLTPWWISKVRAMGWKLLPTWVGPQAPCTNFRVRFSYDPPTAYTQGRNEARAAMTAVRNLQMQVDTPLAYDLEAFNTLDTACVSAAKAFVHGWTSYLALPPRQLSGVYGSVCASALQTFASIPRPPDFIWGAYWNGNPDVYNMKCINGGSWLQRRHKQYAGGHYETWNGVTLYVDSNSSDGPVYTT